LPELLEIPVLFVFMVLKVLSDLSSFGLPVSPTFDFDLDISNSDLLPDFASSV
tara:strand:- start:1109 stop:1267 length:159 start_codon:yes stop_codon:yes gene_type:complete